MSLELPCLKKLVSWTWRALSLSISTRPMIPRKSRGSRSGIRTIRRWLVARNYLNGRGIGSLVPVAYLRSGICSSKRNLGKRWPRGQVTQWSDWGYSAKGYLYRNLRRRGSMLVKRTALG